MKLLKNTLPRAAAIFLVFTILCGVLYTGAVTGLARLLFPYQADGSLIEVNGVKYGSALLGQPFADDGHLWGRAMNLDVTTYKDARGKPLLYAAPSNLSPASAEYAALIARRVEKIKAANPDMGGAAVPVDLVTGSGSGLDPDISPAAAQYQVARIARATGKSEAEIREILAKCTTGRFLGVFGEERVNVLKVNLMLEGIL